MKFYVLLVCCNYVSIEYLGLSLMTSCKSKFLPGYCQVQIFKVVRMEVRCEASLYLNHTEGMI